MRIAVIGAGGVGGYFGGKLAGAGLDVVFSARGGHLSAIKKNGLTVKSILGDFHVDNPAIKEEIREIGHADLILLSTKAWQIETIMDSLREIAGDSGIILPLQNGVTIAEELSRTINKKNILGGLCRIISQVESPGVICHSGVTPEIVFGELDNSDSGRLHEIKVIFNNAGIRSRISYNIESDLWKKFISICVGGLLAVTRTTYGELRGIPETRQMMIDLMQEIYSLSKQAGICIEPEFIARTVSFLDEYPYDSTASLTRDVLEGRPSEIFYQNGAVVKLGEKYGVDTPVNRFIFNCILPMEIKARSGSLKRDN